ncbi:MAG TPA: hypothetical protein VFK15_10560 [Burkholderiales bacterium]|jgi:hypothetical protein|nr:hypothetical protein [Burkholderiales bacterium]
MRAAELGELLETLGVPVLGYREDDGYLGASVRVTDTVHVEISPEGLASVVQINGETDFRFHDARTEVRDIIYDLVAAGAVVLH